MGPGQPGSWISGPGGGAPVTRASPAPAFEESQGEDSQRWEAASLLGRPHTNQPSCLLHPRPRYAPGLQGTTIPVASDQFGSRS